MGAAVSFHRDSLLRFTKPRRGPDSLALRGFTLIELVTVIAVMGLVFGVVGYRVGGFVYWKEESFYRKIRETISYLHSQSFFDQSVYALEFDLDNRDKPTYKVGVFTVADPTSAAVTTGAPPADEGLSEELAAFLYPKTDTDQYFSRPTSLPSLGDPVPFPNGMIIEDIVTIDGKQLGQDGGKVYITFSQRGYSDFAVLHLLSTQDQPVTIVINPFTGNTDLYHEYKDFEWTYGKNQN